MRHIQIHIHYITFSHHAITTLQPPLYINT